jgi:hypothetical protein
MTDPRNVAHDKKVQQEKKHRHEEITPGSGQAQPGKKPHMAPRVEESPADPDPGATEVPPGTP